MLTSYRENNIIFRIASADAISKFKHVQAHSFIQVCRKELDFSSKTREILLLSYDRFSSWVLRTERSFLMIDDHIITDAFCDSLLETIREEFKSIEETCKSNKHIFHEKAVEFLTIIHTYSLPIIDKEIKKIVNKNIESAFTSVIELMTDYLQHILVCIHEIDNNCVKRNPAFLGFTKFCALALTNGLCTPLKQRAEFFKNRGDLVSFMIKNYTEHSIGEEFTAALNNFGFNTYLETPLTPEINASPDK